MHMTHVMHLRGRFLCRSLFTARMAPLRACVLAAPKNAFSIESAPKPRRPRRCQRWRALCRPRNPGARRRQSRAGARAADERATVVRQRGDLAAAAVAAIACGGGGGGGGSAFRGLPEVRAIEPLGHQPVQLGCVLAAPAPFGGPSALLGRACGARGGGDERPHTRAPSGTESERTFDRSGRSALPRLERHVVFLLCGGVYLV